MHITPVEDNTLQPCPFCGNEHVRTYRVDYDEFRVHCDRCEASGPIQVTEGDAEFAWNKTRYRGK